jgi:hypothetical protein
MNELLILTYFFIQIGGIYIIAHYWDEVRGERKTVSILDILMILLFPLFPLTIILTVIPLVILNKIYKICKPVLDIELFKLDK